MATKKAAAKKAAKKAVKKAAPKKAAKKAAIATINLTDTGIEFRNPPCTSGWKLVQRRVNGVFRDVCVKI